jgi:hypothetical protein
LKSYVNMCRNLSGMKKRVRKAWLDLLAASHKDRVWNAATFSMSAENGYKLELTAMEFAKTAREG